MGDVRGFGGHWGSGGSCERVWGKQGVFGGADGVMEGAGGGGGELRVWMGLWGDLTCGGGL